jgi:hypothetical protein
VIDTPAGQRHARNDCGIALDVDRGGFSGDGPLATPATSTPVEPRGNNASTANWPTGPACAAPTFGHELVSLYIRRRSPEAADGSEGSVPCAATGQRNGVRPATLVSLWIALSMQPKD